jgi:hypothetical protein
MRLEVEHRICRFMQQDIIPLSLVAHDPDVRPVPLRDRVGAAAKRLAHNVNLLRIATTQPCPGGINTRRLGTSTIRADDTGSGMSKRIIKSERANEVSHETEVAMSPAGPS